MGRCSVGLGAVAAVLGTATPAHAGAWVAPEGGQEISQFTFGLRDEQPFSESDYFLELPISGRTAFVAQPRLAFSGDAYEASGEVAAGLKMAVVRTPRVAGAIQAAALWRSETIDGCGAEGVEVRSLGGLSSEDRFYNVEAALRLHSGGCFRQRLEFTAGHRPDDNWLLMGQAFLDADPDGGATIKAQASLVRFGGWADGLQLGLRFRIDGDDREPALVLGWWRTPGA